MGWVYRPPPERRPGPPLLPFPLLPVAASTVVTATAIGHAAPSSTTAHNLLVPATAQGAAVSSALSVGVRVVDIDANGHAVSSTLIVAFAAHYVYPDADQLNDGWDTQPTPGGNLFDQLDEDPASDTDFILEVV